MMARQFLPTLRGLFAPQQPAAPLVVETKDLGGNAYVSMSYTGTTTVWGTEGRADGWDMDRVISEGYERSVWTFKAVEAISKHASELPIEIGRGGDELRFAETLEDHPLLRLLNVRANPMESGDVFKKRLSAQLLLSKKGVFIEVTLSRRGTPTRLDLLPPDRVQIIPDPYGDYVRHFEFTSRAGVVRELPPERVIWLRDPHPTDPFCGVTPLEAAGLSVDLDVKARVYNISFIDRDARPGGIVGIDVDGVDPREIERIQQRLAPGAHNAGELTLVGTGPGGINYVDTSARPREMAYETLSATSKGEILAAFGVPESIVGNASERTYANADREEWTFWDHTELPHLNLIASGFDIGLDDGWTVRFDTSRVQALEFPRRQERAEAREEFLAGLISVDEYRKIARREPFNVPQSRALWISPQKAPVPANEQDAAALGLAPEGAAAIPGQAGGTQPSLGPQDDSAAAAVADARGLGDGEDAAATVAAARAQAPLALPGASPGTAADTVAQARTATAEAGPGDAAADVARARGSNDSTPPGEAAADVDAARQGLERKALPEPGGYEATDADFEVLGKAVAAALTALLARQQGVILARLRAPKTRKYTRYWEPDGDSDLRGGDGPIDGDRVVSATRWAEEITDTLTPILQQAAVATAQAVGQSLTGAGSVPPSAAGAALITAAHAGQSVATFLAELAEALHDAQHGATTLDDLVDTVAAFYNSGTPALVAQLAEECSIATINGAAEAAAEAAGPDVVRTWVTRGDTRVRPAHKALHGTTLPAGTPYTVDGYSLRYPGDPFAPTALTINCRCRLHYETDSPYEGTSPLPNTRSNP
ncbi:phage portal protein [Streptomyces sp. NPDC048258]|uniref:phage portal protein n=1 Tax=Streptomyces sp. NPDC048258 TaxID=3365527 RepID=UPI00371284C0